MTSTLRASLNHGEEVHKLVKNFKQDKVILSNGLYGGQDGKDIKKNSSSYLYNRV